MKNINEKTQYLNTKKKIYYGGVALVALMSVSSTVQAMENDYEMSRVRCLWHLEQKPSKNKVYRAAALEILEKKAIQEQADPKVRLSFIKKLGQFLKENPLPETFRSLRADSLCLTEQSSRIAKGELGLFCENTENNKLYCIIRDKEKMELIRSDDPATQGINAASFDRIRNNVINFQGILNLKKEDAAELIKFTSIVGYTNALNLELLKVEKENEEPPLSKFYAETLTLITQSANLSAAEKGLQSLKLKIFYSQLPQVLTSVNIESIKKDINESLLKIRRTHGVESKYLDYIKSVYFENPINLEKLDAFAMETKGTSLGEKFNRKLGLNLLENDRICKISLKAGYFEAASKTPYALAKYYLAELYNSSSSNDAGFYLPNSAYELYVDIVKEGAENPQQKSLTAYSLGAYKLAKFLETGDNSFGLPADLEDALNNIIAAAKYGHPYAQYELAKYYMANQKETEAIELLHHAAESGYFRAQFELAQKYEEGYGNILPKNPELARFWYRKAAEQEEGEAANYPLGHAYEIGKEYEKAISFYEKSKDPRAQVRLGKMYLKGTGKKKNEFLALDLFQKAVDQDNADGNYYLGLMQLKGQCFAKPMLNDSFKNFTSAAQQNHPKALFRLGIINQFAVGTEQNYDAAKNLYENSGIPAAFYYLGNLYKQGLGVEADADKALELWEKAAASGHKKAAYKAGKACFKAWKFKNDEKTAGKARQYLQQAAADSDADALYELGHLQQVTHHSIEAIQHYEIAAKDGHALAQFELGKYYEGTGKTDQAMAYYIKAAEQGYGKARVALRQLYLGKGELGNFFSHFKSPYTEIRSVDLTDMKVAVKKGYPQAIKWFADEAPQDNPSVQYFLGKLLEKGVHLGKDMPKAIELYQKAAKQGNRSAQRQLADFKQAHLLEAFQLEGTEIAIKPSPKAFKESLKKGDQVLEKSQVHSNDGAIRVVDNVKKNKQDILLEEGDKKEKYIEKRENFNILKTTNCIDAVEQHIGEGNHKIAKYLDEVLQEHLDQEDDFKLAASIDSSVGKNSIQQLLEDSGVVEYLNNSSEISISNQNKSST